MPGRVFFAPWLEVDEIVDFIKLHVDSLLSSPVVTSLVALLHSLLTRMGIPSHVHPSADQLALSLMCTVVTLSNYYLLFGNRHVSNRKQLASDLTSAALRVHELEEKLLVLAAEEVLAKERAKESDGAGCRPVRIFMDGAFDMMHYGHMNAFRQGAALGTQLIVGVNSDASITQCKGPPVMNDQERLTAVEGCKFVDEVVPGCPYVMNADYLAYVIKTYNIDFVVHGDDPCIVDGKDVYEAAKQSGRYQSIPRTEGVSTTDIVGRMLLMTKDHHKTDEDMDSELVMNRSPEHGIVASQSKFLTTSRMLRLFSAGVKAPSKDMNIIYMDGSWDMFHAGHIAILKKAKDMGDYLIVGVHSDSTVNGHKGSNFPIMNLHERVLSVLGCKFVDDVLIDAPYEIEALHIANLNISKVVKGSASCSNEDLRYSVPKKSGIYEVIDSPTDFSLSNIMDRIAANQEAFQNKINKKKKVENEYYEERYKDNETYKSDGGGMYKETVKEAAVPEHKKTK
jgi:ethanolamine-phosphate cytidylyltransferase